MSITCRCCCWIPQWLSVVAEMHVRRYTQRASARRKRKGMTIIFLLPLRVKKMKNRPDAEILYCVHARYARCVNGAYTNLRLMPCCICATMNLLQPLSGQIAGMLRNLAASCRPQLAGILLNVWRCRFKYVNAKPLSAGNEIPVDDGENPLLDVILYFKNAQTRCQQPH